MACKNLQYKAWSSMDLFPLMIWKWWQYMWSKQKVTKYWNICRRSLMITCMTMHLKEYGLMTILMEFLDALPADLMHAFLHGIILYVVKTSVAPLHWLKNLTWPFGWQHTCSCKTRRMIAVSMCQFFLWYIQFEIADCNRVGWCCGHQQTLARELNPCTIHAGTVP